MAHDDVRSDLQVPSDVVQPSLPWPYEGGEFPAELGVVVMVDVLAGRQPARQVVHFADGRWAIGDGITWPSDRNLTLTHMSHLLALDPSLRPLASMPPDHQADRDATPDPWTITLYVPPSRPRLHRIVDAMNALYAGRSGLSRQHDGPDRGTSGLHTGCCDVSC